MASRNSVGGGLNMESFLEAGKNLEVTMTMKFRAPQRGMAKAAPPDTFHQCIKLLLVLTLSLFLEQ